jgi:precorrin-6B methylase 2
MAITDNGSLHGLQSSTWSRRKVVSRVLRIAAKTGRADLVRKLTEQLARLRVREITNEIVRSAGLGVQSGPFSGMVLPARTSWVDGDLTPKVLGCYEAELHLAVRQAVERRPAVVINVGCAEGFYAVGLARLLPHAKVYAFDIHERARAVCREAADTNGVGERLRVDGACTAQRLMELAGDNRVLIVLDCEGAEYDLITTEASHRLSKGDLLIEAHDFIVPDVTAILERRLSATHAVERIVEQSRDPNAFPALHDLSDLDRALAICEFRPGIMTWLAAWSRE